MVLFYVNYYSSRVNSGCSGLQLWGRRTRACGVSEGQRLEVIVSQGPEPVCVCVCVTDGLFSAVTCVLGPPSATRESGGLRRVSCPCEALVRVVTHSEVQLARLCSPRRVSLLLCCHGDRRDRCHTENNVSINARPNLLLLLDVRPCLFVKHSGIMGDSITPNKRANGAPRAAPPGRQTPGGRPPSFTAAAAPQTTWNGSSLASCLHPGLTFDPTDPNISDLCFRSTGVTCALAVF